MTTADSRVLYANSRSLNADSSSRVILEAMMNGRRILGGVVIRPLTGAEGCSP
jgi:hypothetical protein